jgi:hypothetical protein
MEEELLKNLIGEYVRQQQAAQTERRIRGRKLDVLGHLEKRLLSGEITEKDYRMKKTRYVDTLYELYIKDIISYEELLGKINR